MNSKVNFLLESIFYVTISATLILLIAQGAGITDVSFHISTSAILLSIIAYIISYFSSKTIEKSILSIETSASVVETASKQILKLQNDLTNEFVGQTSGFDELFDKTILLLEESVKNKSNIKLILPFPSFGFINKNTREKKYGIFKSHIKSLINSEQFFELYILNPFKSTWDRDSNELSSFFYNIINYGKNEIVYEQDFSKIIKEYFLFLSEICLFYDNSPYKEKKSIYLLDKIFQNCILSEHNGNYKSLLFFLHPPLDELKPTDNNVIVSNGYYSLTGEFRILVEKLITIQKEKFNATSIFSDHDPLDLYFILKDISEEIRSTHSSDQCCDKINLLIKKSLLNNYNNYIRIKNDQVDIRLFEFGTKNDNESYLLIFPSAAGVFSHNPNYRFNVYRKLCTDLSQNRKVLLCSFSGQDNFSEFEEKTFKFSLSQTKIDIQNIFKHLAGKNILGLFAICIGAQSYLSYSKDECTKLPIFIWDMPDRPGWKIPEKYFEKHKINVDYQQCKKTEDPIATLQDFNEGNIFYAFSNKSRNATRKFEEIIKLLSSKATDKLKFQHKEYNYLEHVPCNEDNKIKYTELINDINIFFSK